MTLMSDQNSNTKQTISGIDVMRGVGAKPAKGFWADAWDLVIRQWGARLAMAWIAVVGFFAITAPYLANGLPIWTTEYTRMPDGSYGEAMRSFSPLWSSLTSIDLMLLIGGIVAIPWLALPLSVIPLKRSKRLGILCAAVIQSGVTLVLVMGISDFVRGDHASDWMRNAATAIRWTAPFVVGVVIAALCIWLPTFKRFTGRVVLVAIVLVASGLASAERWSTPISNYERYIEGEIDGRYSNTYTIIPWSPNQSRTDLYLVDPMETVAEKLTADNEERVKEGRPAANLNEIEGEYGERRFLLGTDAVGQDVLSQMMHACRLSISIGLVSTGISVFIGIVIGSLMGYFGGWVDLLLSRIVEVFLAIPVLFLLIVAAAVLPRNTYVMMAIIGCVSWTLAARFIRAEFLSMRKQDFVQAARAAGLPLRSVLFRHMLPNGVTPVLVQASFAIAAAILAEATLSFLGLGPVDQASWGKLLSSATGTTGTFVWWLAIFPGLAIFLTVLAYNLLGEAFQTAIDPKLRKAAH